MERELGRLRAEMRALELQLAQIRAGATTVGTKRCFMDCKIDNFGLLKYKI